MTLIILSFLTYLNLFLFSADIGVIHIFDSSLERRVHSVRPVDEPGHARAGDGSVGHADTGVGR